MKKIAIFIMTMVMLLSCVTSVSAAATTSTISVGGVETAPGKQVVIPITISKNSGFVSLSLKVTYDTSVLTLISVSDTGLIEGNPYHSANYDSPYKLNWMNDISTTNTTKTGKIVDLIFKVSDDALEGKYAINIGMGGDDALDANGNSVSFATNAGYVTVVKEEHICSFGAWDRQNSKQHIRYCTDCDNYETASHTWNNGKVVSEPTCEDDGEIEYTCEDCGATKSEFEYAEGHSYGSWAKYSATQHKRTCSSCGGVEYENHGYGAWSKYSTTQHKHSCADCGNVEYKDHNWNSGVVTTPPTATTAGVKTYTCGDCSATKTESIPPNPIPVTGITLTPSSLTLEAGKTSSLNATVAPSNATNKNVTWTTSDATVATVSSGVVTANKAGTATITVKSVDGNFTATCVVTVKAAPVPVTGITLDKTAVSLDIGKSALVYATITPSDATNQNIIWKNSNDSVAQVNISGKKTYAHITALAAGTTTITATTEDGNFVAKCVVTVKAPEPDYSQGLAYTSNGDGTCYVSGIGTCTDTEIVIPSKSPAGDTVTGIGYDPFIKCSKPTSIVIPDTITDISTSAFINANNVVSITVDNNNSNYKSIDGNLYSKDGKILCQYAPGKSDTSFTIPSHVTEIGNNSIDCKNLISIIIPESVTCIRQNAFCGCESLTSITIPDSVTCMEGNSFGYCRNLISVIVGNGITNMGFGAFRDCSSLTSIMLPDQLTRIEGYTFDSCEKLTSITIPNSVTKIEHCVFFGCTSLTNINFTGTTAEWIAISKHSQWDDGTPSYTVYCTNGTVSKDGTVTPNAPVGSQGLAYTSNGDGTCYVSGIGTCTDTEIVIPSKSPAGDQVVRIGSDAFESLRNITSVSIPYGVTSIGDWAFWGCYGLTSINIPSSVQSIESCAFIHCPLKSITIPSSVTSIGSNAFMNCTKLESITVEQGNTVYHSAGNCLIETKTKTLLFAFKNSFIPADGSVTTIADSAFNGLLLEKIDIPVGITTIGSRVFEMCKFTSIHIPSSVTNIADRAFAYCGTLEQITVDKENKVYHVAGNCLIETATKTLITGCNNSVIPIDGSVTSIAPYAFEACRSMISIDIPDGITSIGRGAFTLCQSLTSIYIPDSVTSIDFSVFASTRLERINFAGTTAEWLAIAKVNNWDYGTPDYTVYCTDGTVSKDGTVTPNEPAGSQGLAYTSNGDGTCYVSGIGTCTDTEIVIPSKSPAGDTVTGIGKDAGSNSNLAGNYTSISIPDTVTTIGGWAFYQARGLKSITIPASVTKLGECLFDACPNLVSITVEKGNPVYHSTNNCIIETATKTLVATCQTSTIPNDGSVTIIGGRAFQNNASTITKIVIPKGITSIGYMAFISCPKLTTIEIPISVTEIDGGVIGLCYSLTTINFAGTTAQWLAIDLDKNWNLNSGNYTVYCTDGTVSKDGTVTPNKPVGGASIEITSHEANAGDTIKVEVKLTDNPGLASISLQLAYNQSLLTLTNIEYNTAVMGGSPQPPQTMNSPVTLMWLHGFADYSGECVFATLTFKVSENAKEGDVVNISATYNPDDVYNIKEENVALNITPGKVTVIKHVPGDINGDGVRNNKDITRFMQYNAGWNVTVNARALDVNGDGKVNNKDVTRLMQYNAGWDVVIY